MLVETGGCIVLIRCVATFYKSTKACHKDFATSVCAGHTRGWFMGDSDLGDLAKSGAGHPVFGDIPNHQVCTTPI